MNPRQPCPNCGSPLPPDAPAGVCPKCLLQAGLSDSAADVAADSADGTTVLTDAAGLEQAAELPPTEPDGRSSGFPDVGTRIQYIGDYELLREIARGGMGVVYKARQLRLNRVVALKMILAGQFASPADVQRFQTEAEAAAGLDHPGIVPIFEVGQHEGHHYFSMGLVEGESLAKRIADGPLPPRMAADLVLKVVEAIKYAHKKGVIHRDLKPANILLDHSGQPRVTDFGLAKRLEGDSNLTGSGQILGTPSYMPPEQAAGRIDQVAEPADIYSMGAVLYATLTGRPPFQADNLLDTVMQVIEREPVAPRVLNPKIPLDIETICLKCLEKDRRRRYASAGELAEELRRYLDGEPIRARPVGRLEHAWRWCRRKPALAMAAGLALASTFAAIVILAVAVAVVSNSRNNERTARSKESEERKKAENLARANAQLAMHERASREKAEDARTQESQQRQRAESELTRAEGLLYANQIASALREWETNDVHSAWSYLNACREELRGWEFHYLHSRFNAGHQTFRGHTAVVSSVTFSPDGQRIASGSSDQTVKVWDAVSGQEFVTLNGHTGNVASVAFSPDGQRIASASWDKTLKVWDPASGQEKCTLKGHTSLVWSVAFSPDGQQIASGSSDGTVKLWDVANGQQVLELKVDSVNYVGTASVTSVAFSPDGKRIIGGSADQTVKVWDAASGEVIARLKGHTGHVSSVAVSRDGQRIASAGFDKLVKVWDANNGEELLTLKGHTANVSSVAFTPDGRRIVSGSWNKTVRVWDSNSGQELTTLWGHTGGVGSVAFSPDGLRIASGGGFADNTVKVWDASRNQEMPIFRGHTATVLTAACSPDGKHMASGSGSPENMLKIWDVTTNQETLSVKGGAGSVETVAFSPDGQRIVSGGGASDKTIRVLDATSGQELLAFKGNQWCVASVAFSPDGEQIVSGGGAGGFGDNTVRLWSAKSGQELLVFNGHTRRVTSVAFSPDGKRVASASDDLTLKVWDAQNGRETLTLKGHANFVNSVAFSPDGKWIASGSRDTTVKVWDSATGQELFTLKGHTEGVSCVAFSPDGQRIASASEDKTLKLWNANTGQETLTLKGHASAVTSIAFSSDGSRIVSGSGDHTLRVWDAARTTITATPETPVTKTVVVGLVHPMKAEVGDGNKDADNTGAGDKIDDTLLEILQGEWIPVSAILDGEPSASNEAQWSVVFEGQTMSERLGDRVAGRFDIKHLVASGDLGHLDIKQTTLAGSRLKMLFTLDGNTLTTCVRNPPGERPVNLMSKSGSKQRLTILHRVQK